jgi:serine/threonine protein phosphatase PrpC
MSFVRRLLGRETEDAHQADSPSPPADAPSRQPEADFGGPGRTEPQASEMTMPSPQEAEPVAEAAVQSIAESVSAQARQRTSNHAEPEPHVEGLRVGYASDVGQLRAHNEDTLIAFQGVHLGDDASGPFGFFVVTDGMGGHQAGEVASSLAARLVTHQVIEDVYLPFLLNETPSADMAPLTEVLRNAVEEANNQVHERVPGGGTTLTCALVMGRRAYIAHVGDSRAYLLTGRDMRRLTQDHSFVNRLIELGELSPEDAAVHPQRHVLYRAVGQGDSLDIDTYQQPLPPGSRLLLCSDGLSGQVSEEEIGMIIASAATPQGACQRLVEAANRAGGPDNITAVIIETPMD